MFFLQKGKTKPKQNAKKAESTLCWPTTPQHWADLCFVSLVYITWCVYLKIEFSHRCIALSYIFCKILGQIFYVTLLPIIFTSLRLDSSFWTFVSFYIMLKICNLEIEGWLLTKPSAAMEAVYVCSRSIVCWMQYINCSYYKHIKMEPTYH